MSGVKLDAASFEAFLELMPHLGEIGTRENISSPPGVPQLLGQIDINVIPIGIIVNWFVRGDPP